MVTANQRGRSDADRKSSAVNSLNIVRRGRSKLDLVMELEARA
jgi:hypothetical protein